MSDPRDQLQADLAGRYIIERELGRGGMATVYLAEDLRHQRRVALKLLDPQPGVVLGAERFLAEIRVTANLQHRDALKSYTIWAARRYSSRPRLVPWRRASTRISRSGTVTPTRRASTA